MYRPSALLLAVAALSRLVHAGDHTYWYTTTCWSTEYHNKEPETVYKEPETVYKVSTETVYNEVTTTVYQDVPTTVVQPVTVTVTQVVSVVDAQTVYNTVQDTVTQVATQVQTDTAVQYQTVTVTNVAATTVSAACPTTSSLTGLVLCESRIINPTYTPPEPLPTDYIWGCPPGYICEPPKINCNFERAPPADTYVCEPEQCQIAGPLPSLEEVINNPPLGSNCAWLTPDPGYFDLNPTDFGYTYGIFNIFGQPQCPAQCPPPSTVTVVETAPGASAPPPVTVVVTVTVTVTESPAPPPPPAPPSQAPPSTKVVYNPPPSSTWQTWQEPAKPTPATWNSWVSSEHYEAASTWQGWPKGSPTYSHQGSKITQRAALDKRLLFHPKPCYNFANHAQKLFQSIGSDSSRLCPRNGVFSIAYNTAVSCYSASRTVMPSAEVARLTSALAYCSRNPVNKREADAPMVFPRGVRQVRDMV